MQKYANENIIGIILLNLGGPDSLQAVRPFLFNLFSDRQIIRLGPLFLQKPIARLISAIRSKKTERLYSLIGGKSPILDITLAQARALEMSLNALRVMRHTPFRFKVYVGMRYWHPFIEDMAPEILNDRVKKLIAISLYPQYSIATTGSSVSKLKEVLSQYLIEIHTLPSWFNNPFYVEALVEVIKKGLASFYSELSTPNFEPDIHVLFSAHSLPQKFIDEGDPYVKEIMGTVEETTKRIPLKWHLSYQSKSGPVRWLGPSTDKKLKELAQKGVRNVLVVPISFVSDHIETLYEIDILYKKMAEDLGINLKRTESLNTHPFFIEALKDIVIKCVKELDWKE